MMKWPSASPSQGHKSLPKRADSDQHARSSFRSDLLGALGGVAVQVEPVSSGRPSAAAVPPEASARGSRTDVQDSRRSDAAEPLKHRWKWQSGRWICTNCLSASRLAIPRQIFGCRGMAPNIRSLLQRPQGHKLQIATFTSGAGIVVICSGCGRFTTSNRRGVLHKEKCPSLSQAAFQSDGARAAYRRVCEGMHPAYKEGNSRILDPCISAETLLQIAAEQTQP